jgi:hypothetical protein
MTSDGDVPDGALIAASVIAGVRHLLIESGVWDEVRATLVRREPEAAHWIEAELAVDPTKIDWVTAAHYGELMDAIFDVVGSDRAFALGRERLHRTAQAGAFAPVVRSWARSFGDSPEEFLRLTTHAWSTQTRNFGLVRPTESRLGHARFLIEEAAPVIRDSAGWHRFLSGYGTGLLDLIHREGRCIVRRDRTGRHVEIIYDYDEPPSRSSNG